MAYDAGIGTSTADYNTIRPYALVGGQAQAQEKKPVLSFDQSTGLLGNVSVGVKPDNSIMGTGLEAISKSINGVNEGSPQKMFTSIGQAVVDNATEEAIRKKKEAYMSQKLDDIARMQYAKSLLGNLAQGIVRRVGY